jgi:hypothetical protein
MKSRYLAFALLVLAMSNLGCNRDPMLDKPEFRSLVGACSRKHVYWRVECDSHGLLDNLPSCSGSAWTGSRDVWGTHNQDWRVYSHSAEDAAIKLATALDNAPNYDRITNTYDSGIQECKPEGAK